MEVEVCNNGPFEWKEEFKGELIVIPAGKSVTMGRAKAVNFLSQYSPFSKEGDERTLNKKMLVIKEDPEKAAAMRDQPFKYTATDGTKFRTLQGAEAYEKQLSGVKRGRSAS